MLGPPAGGIEGSPARTARGKERLMQRFFRWFRILQLIPVHPKFITSRQLEGALAQRGIVLTQRSIQRDLMELSRWFPMVCRAKGRPFGWAWMPEGYAPAAEVLARVAAALPDDAAAAPVPHRRQSTPTAL